MERMLKYSSKYELISASILILKKHFALNDQLLDTYKWKKRLSMKTGPQRISSVVKRGDYTDDYTDDYTAHYTDDYTT